MALPSKLGRLAIKAQASGWGAAETSFSSTNYLEVDGIVIPDLVTEALRADVFRPDFTEPQIVAGSKAGAEVSISFPLHGWSSDSPSGAPAAHHPDALLLENALRGSTVIATAYTTALASGSSDSMLRFTNGLANTNWEGQAMLVPTESGTIRMVGWIRDVDTVPSPDTATVWRILQAPDSSGTVFGSITIPLATTQPKPLTMQWLGSSDKQALRLSDGVVTKAKITLQAKKQPKCEVTLRFLNWTAVGSGGAPAPYAYGYPQMPVVTGSSGAYKTENDTATAAWQNFSQAVISIDVTTQDSECASSSQGADSIVVTDRRVTVELTEPYVEGNQGFDTWSGVTPGTSNGEFVLVANTTPGRAFSALIPASVILEQTKIQDASGIVAVRRVFGCRPYSGDGGTGSGAGNTPFRIAFL